MENEYVMRDMSGTTSVKRNAGRGHAFLRVALAAAAVLLLCGAVFVGAGAAENPAPGTYNWNSEKRGLLKKCLDRIGFGGYLKIADSYPNFVKLIKNVCDEFRTIKENAGKR